MNPDSPKPDSPNPDRWTPPDPVLARPIRTERLVVDPFTLDDAGPLFEIIQAMRPTAEPWLDWVHTQHRSLEETTRWVADQALRLSDPGFRSLAMVIREPDSRQIFGGAGVYDLDPDTRSCSTGYWIRPDRRGHAFAGEACRAVISWCLRPQPEGLGLSRVRLFCSADNSASRRVLEKLGLPFEMHQRRQDFVAGFGLTDRLGWGVLADEWDCERHTMAATAG
ncbi:MAG: GNAT family N-acetyltransferase [Planctomycetota bacterium]